MAGWLAALRHAVVRGLRRVAAGLGALSRCLGKHGTRPVRRAPRIDACCLTYARVWSSCWQCLTYAHLWSNCWQVQKLFLHARQAALRHFADRASCLFIRRCGSDRPCRGRRLKHLEEAKRAFRSHAARGAAKVELRRRKRSCGTRRARRPQAGDHSVRAWQSCPRDDDHHVQHLKHRRAWKSWNGRHLPRACAMDRWRQRTTSRRLHTRGVSCFPLPHFLLQSSVYMCTCCSSENGSCSHKREDVAGENKT